MTTETGEACVASNFLIGTNLRRANEIFEIEGNIFGLVNIVFTFNQKFYL